MKVVNGFISVNADVLERLSGIKYFFKRNWLVERCTDFKNNSNQRHLIIVSGPGTGKSVFIADLARSWNCPRHFIRVGHTRGITGSSTKAFLISIGTQLYQRYGRHIFDSAENRKTRVNVGSIEDNARVVGRYIEEIVRLPFLPVTTSDVQVNVRHTSGSARTYGEFIGKWIDSAESLDPETLLHMAVLNPLQRLSELEPNETVVILVDALDEGSGEKQTDIYSILPSTDDAACPPNLKCIFTTRKEKMARYPAEDCLFLDHYRDSIELELSNYINHALNDEPLQSHLANWSAQERAVYHDRLLQNSDYNLLFLYHYINEIATQITKNALTNIRTIRIPSGIDEIYRYFAVEKIKADHDMREWISYYLPVLGLLAVVQSYVTRKQLAAFSGIEVGYVDYVIPLLDPFLENDDTGTGYRFFHKSFSDYLLDEKRNTDYYLEPSHYHRMITDYYKQGKSNWDKVDWKKFDENYPYKYLATHLDQAGLQQELFDLIGQAWLKAQYNHSDSYNYFVDDLLLAINFATSTNNIDYYQLFRCGCIHSRIVAICSSVTPDIIAALALSGQVKTASNYARLIKNPQKRADAYYLLARCLAHLGKAERAMSAIHEACIATNIIEYDDIKYQKQCDNALFLKQAGRTDELSKLGEHIPASSTSMSPQPLAGRGLANVRFWAIKLMNLTGFAARKTQLIDEINDDIKRTYTGLNQHIQALSVAHSIKSLDRASKQVSSYDNDHLKLLMLSALALAYAYLQNSNKLKKCIRSFNALYDQPAFQRNTSTGRTFCDDDSGTVSRMARASAMAGDFDLAFKYYKEVLEGRHHNRDHYLRKLTCTLASIFYKNKMPRLIDDLIDIHSNYDDTDPSDWLDFVLELFFSGDGDQANAIWHRIIIDNQDDKLTGKDQYIFALAFPDKNQATRLIEKRLQNYSNISLLGHNLDAILREQYDHSEQLIQLHEDGVRQGYDGFPHSPLEFADSIKGGEENRSKIYFSEIIYQFRVNNIPISEANELCSKIFDEDMYVLAKLEIIRHMIRANDERVREEFRKLVKLAALSGLASIKQLLNFEANLLDDATLARLKADFDNINNWQL